MVALLSSSDLQIIPMPTKSVGVQVNQTMTANDEHLHVNTNDANTNCIIFIEDGSHQVNVASEYGVDYDGNNPLQRLILPLMMTPETGIQLAVMNYFQQGAASHFYDACIHRLIVVSVSEGARQVAPVQQATSSTILKLIECIDF